jgi:hypothetical protein
MSLKDEIKSGFQKFGRSRWLNFRFLPGAKLAFRPGHFFSPICNPMELVGRYHNPCETTEYLQLPGITVNLEDHLERWNRWRDFLADALLHQLLTQVIAPITQRTVLAMRLFYFLCCGSGSQSDTLKLVADSHRRSR